LRTTILAKPLGLQPHARMFSSITCVHCFCDTLIHLQKPSLPDAVWEIALPNGTYTVHAVSGDPGYFDSRFDVRAEGQPLVSGTPTSAARFVEGMATVTVSDGRLTLSNGPNAQNNKLCFVDITPR
jgi:hypothetical protein